MTPSIVIGREEELATILIGSQAAFFICVDLNFGVVVGGDSGTDVR